MGLIILLWLVFPAFLSVILKVSMLIVGARAFGRGGGERGLLLARRLTALHLCEPALTMAATAWLCMARSTLPDWSATELLWFGLPDHSPAFALLAPLALISLLPLAWVRSADPVLAVVARRLALGGAVRWACGLLALLVGPAVGTLILSCVAQWRLLRWADGALAVIRRRELERVPAPQPELGYYVPPAL
ncbi:MAG TPA: hypothetical protein VGE07_21075 [Herpetosiphonaceae bacterium]